MKELPMTDALDRLLQQDARQGLADDGFSARVMRTLPPVQVRAPSWIMPLLILGSAALGSVLAVLFAPAGFSLVQGFQDLVQMRGMTQAAMGGLAIAGALMVSAVIFATSAD
jgi:hypothetical protein